MLKLQGKVLNVFKTPEGKNREGENYGGENRVQLQTENHLRNGELRIELVNLTTKQPDLFIEHLKKEIVVDVGAFARQSSIMYYLPDNFEIEPFIQK